MLWPGDIYKVIKINFLFVYLQSCESVWALRGVAWERAVCVQLVPKVCGPSSQPGRHGRDVRPALPDTLPRTGNILKDETARTLNHGPRPNTLQHTRAISSAETGRVSFSSFNHQLVGLLIVGINEEQSLEYPLDQANWPNLTSTCFYRHRLFLSTGGMQGLSNSSAYKPSEVPWDQRTCQKLRNSWTYPNPSPHTCNSTKTCVKATAFTLGWFRNNTIFKCRRGQLIRCLHNETIFIMHLITTGTPKIQKRIRKKKQLFGNQRTCHKIECP